MRWGCASTEDEAGAGGHEGAVDAHDAGGDGAMEKATGLGHGQDGEEDESVLGLAEGDEAGEEGAVDEDLARGQAQWDELVA